MGLEKAEIRNTDTGATYSVLFNPEQYSLSRGNNFAQVPVPGLSAPLLQFSHGELQTLQMDLFFDSREEHFVANVRRTQQNGDVRDEVNKFLALMDITPDTHAPPVLQFHWGSLKDFLCVLVSANQRYTMFREDGCPLRCTVQATFNRFTNAEMEAKQVNRQTADYTKVHTVSQGDTLAGIAFAEYGDPSLWRPIALQNELGDPRSLPVGQDLIIPRLPYREPGGDRVFPSA